MAAQRVTNGELHAPPGLLRCDPHQGRWRQRGASEQRLLLARLLWAPEDAWLRLHFLHGAEQDEGSRSSAERKLSLSEEYLKQGELHRARQQVELLLQQLGDSYLDSNRGPLQLRLRRVTWTTFSRLAAALLDSGDCGAALALLRRAHGAVMEIGDKRLEAEAALQLGRTNQSAGNHHAARQFFNSCMQICGTLGDTDGLLEACMATAECLESEGSYDEAVQCLEEVVEITRSNGLQEQLAETYMHLGNNYYSRARCRTACDYFLQSCQAARDAGNRSLLEDAQVMVGVCRARSSFESYMADVASSSPSALRRLWRYEAAGAERDPDSGAEEG
ncbi:uncharacterized protein LOC115381428 isoform X2 [Salarias fasciatus]|uniref:uncharacterized protein LOC115381428 isoform X2 n=2 Tax=Salarias fasciatus TaxID=181472 RepID=UPI00117708DE|nr:uncharacterized protein LOC115381428 isoform X2 [Salarias fasciatus]